LLTNSTPLSDLSTWIFCQTECESFDKMYRIYQVLYICVLEIYSHHEREIVHK